MANTGDGFDDMDKTVGCYNLPLNVLENIFNYLPTMDLKNCRLVCNDWNKEASRVILQKTRVYLRIIRHPDFDSDTEDSDVQTEYGKFVPYQYSSGYPTNSDDLRNFRSFRIASEMSEGGPAFMSNYQHLMSDIVFNITEQDLPELFQMLPNLSNLKFLGFLFSDHSYKTAISSLCGMVTLPSVVHLSLYSVDRYYSETRIHVHKFLERLFLLLPNLTVITGGSSKGKFVNFDDEYDRGETLKAITNTAMVLPKLQNFNMKLRTDSAIKGLVQKYFPLTKLDFTASSTVGLQSIQDFLDHFSPTLKNLTIRGATQPTGRFGNDVPNIGVPTTDDIFVLRICEKFNNLTDLQLIWMKGSLDVIHLLPKLKFLKLKNFNFGNRMILNKWNLHDLETLIINCVTEPTCSLSFIKCFLTQFPNVIHLEMDNLRDLPLHFILTNFVKLQSLNLRGSDLRDIDIIGDANWRLFQRVRHDKFPDMPISDIEPDVPVAFLKDLKELHLTSDNLTDVSIIYGLTKCRKLENLKIESSKVSFHAMMKLANVVPVKRLDMGHTEDYCHTESLLSKINKVDSVKEFKINGWLIQNQKYNPNEMDTLDMNINRNIRAKYKKQTEASGRCCAASYDEELEESIEMWEVWENDCISMLKQKFDAPFLH